MWSHSKTHSCVAVKDRYGYRTCKTGYKQVRMILFCCITPCTYCKTYVIKTYKLLTAVSLKFCQLKYKDFFPCPNAYHMSRKQVVSETLCVVTTEKTLININDKTCNLLTSLPEYGPAGRNMKESGVNWLVPNLFYYGHLLFNCRRLLLTVNVLNYVFDLTMRSTRGTIYALTQNFRAVSKVYGI
jgi:hypothetical protein